MLCAAYTFTDDLSILECGVCRARMAGMSLRHAVLGKLTEAQLVTLVAAGGRGRKAYAVTDAGRAELVHWLVEEPPTANRRNDLLLRLFFLGLVPPEQAQAFLHTRAAAAAAL